MNIDELREVEGVIEIIGNLSSEPISLTTDSRNTKDKNVFIGLVGEKFDGFDYLEDIVSSDVSVFVVQDGTGRKEKLLGLSKSAPGKCFILVEDSLTYLQKAANFKIRKWKRDCGGIVLGLTGSNGKTTTKELLFGLSSFVFGDEVYCTQGNYNNHIGVPLTIFDIRDTHRFAIIEMGTNHFGEIKVLCEIAEPDYGFITNIGASHLEFLENEDGVYKEKMALYNWIEKNGITFFANSEDRYLSRAHHLDKTFLIAKGFKNYEFENVYIKESFNKWNLYCSLIILSNIFPKKKDEFMTYVSKVRLPDNKRTQWITLNNTQIYLDAYNANPSSMEASLKSFADLVKIDQCLIVLGDMNELGDKTPEYHENIGVLLSELGAKRCFFIGRYAKFYQKGFSGECEIYENVDEIDAQWKKVLNSYKYIFLKGSRSLQLERLVDITD